MPADRNWRILETNLLARLCNVFESRMTVPLLEALPHTSTLEGVRRGLIALTSAPQLAVIRQQDKSSHPIFLEPGDWARAADVSVEESMIAWYAHCVADPNANCPRNAQLHAEALSEPRRAWTKHGATLTLDLLRSFAAQGIPVRVIKGQPLAQAVYGDYSLRNSSDIDLVVPVRCVADATEHLRKQGFSTALSLQWFKDERFLRLNKEASFFALGGAFTVDLHWGLVNRWNAQAVEQGELFESRGHTVELMGQALPWFDASLLFRIQLAHVISSDFVGLKAWVDLAHVSDLLSPEEWSACEGICSNLGAERALALALMVLEKVFNRPLPLPTSHADRVRLAPTVTRISACLFAGRVPRPFLNSIKIALIVGGARNAWRAFSQAWKPAMIDFERVDATTGTTTLVWQMIMRRSRQHLFSTKAQR